MDQGMEMLPTYFGGKNQQLGSYCAVTNCFLMTLLNGQKETWRKIIPLLSKRPNLVCSVVKFETEIIRDQTIEALIVVSLYPCTLYLAPPTEGLLRRLESGL